MPIIHRRDAAEVHANTRLRWGSIGFAAAILAVTASQPAVASVWTLLDGGVWGQGAAGVYVGTTQDTTFGTPSAAAEPISVFEQRTATVSTLAQGTASALIRQAASSTVSDDGARVDLSELSRVTASVSRVAVDGGSNVSIGNNVDAAGAAYANIGAVKPGEFAGIAYRIEPTEGEAIGDSVQVSINADLRFQFWDNSPGNSFYATDVPAVSTAPSYDGELVGAFPEKFRILKNDTPVHAESAPIKSSGRVLDELTFDAEVGDVVTIDATSGVSLNLSAASLSPFDVPLNMGAESRFSLDA
ncbi:MAG: hypothetical protein GVY09_12455 [Gammaproteobacteria bacterium]|jgi:hypothetical protein|nr:hypothetical protein [Gammaproteobacteria bacterium]